MSLWYEMTLPIDPAFHISNAESLSSSPQSGLP